MTDKLASQGSDNRRWHGLCVVVFAVLLIGLIPANALAAGESAGPGWTPQGEGASAPDGGDGPIRHGSSLGSAGGAPEAEPTTQAPAPSTGSTDYVEPSPEYPESTSSESSEALVPTTPEESTVAPVTPDQDRAESAASANVPPAKVDVGAGVPIARTAPAPVPADTAAAADTDPAAAPAPIAKSSEEAAGGSGIPSWLLVLVVALVAFFVGRALLAGVLRRRRRRISNADRHRKAEDWEAVLEQIRHEQVTGGRRRPPRPAGVEPSYGVVVDGEGAGAGQEPVRNGAKPARVS